MPFCSNDDPIAVVLKGNRNSRMTAIRNLTMKYRTKNASTEGKIAEVRNRTLPKAPREIPEKKLGSLFDFEIANLSLHRKVKSVREERTRRDKGRPSRKFFLLLVFVNFGSNLDEQCLKQMTMHSASFWSQKSVRRSIIYI